MLPSLRRTVSFVLLVGVLSLAAFASTASARVLWNANAERAWNEEWANYSCQDGSRVQQVQAPAAQGSRAYRLEVRDGDDSYGERCELGQGNPTRTGFPLFNDGDERWISFQTYLPDDYPTHLRTWNVFMQLKQLHSFGTPAVSMEIQDGNFVLMNSDTNGTSSNTVRRWQGPAIKNRWVKFTLHVKFSPDARVGYIELYGDLDGGGVKQLMQRTYMHTMKVDGNGATVQSHSRIGLYRNPAVSGTTHIFFDGYSVGDDRASVETAAFAPSVAEVTPTLPPTEPSTAAPAPAPAPDSSSSTTKTSKKSRGSKRRKAARVWLRVKRGGLRAAGWGRTVPVYGGIRRGRRVAGRRVVIQVRHGGRWEWLARGRLNRRGRYYLAPSLDMPHGRLVKLRAVVRGVGRSGTLRTRVR